MGTEIDWAIDTAGGDFVDKVGNVVHMELGYRNTGKIVACSCVAVEAGWGVTVGCRTGLVEEIVHWDLIGIADRPCQQAHPKDRPAILVDGASLAEEVKLLVSWTVLDLSGTERPSGSEVEAVSGSLPNSARGQHRQLVVSTFHGHPPAAEMAAEMAALTWLSSCRDLESRVDEDH